MVSKAYMMVVVEGLVRKERSVDGLERRELRLVGKQMVVSNSEEVKGGAAYWCAEVDQGPDWK